MAKTSTRARTRAPQNAKADPTKPYDAAGGRCPECGAPVHMYADPDRLVSGPMGYPALLIHYEKSHTAYAGGVPQGWSTPPPPPKGDEWEVSPPDREDWLPINVAAAEKGLPQDDGVWPPVRVIERPR